MGFYQVKNGVSFNQSDEGFVETGTNEEGPDRIFRQDHFVLVEEKRCF